MFYPCTEEALKFSEEATIVIKKSAAKHVQVIYFKAFHFSSTLSIEVFYEGSRHFDRNSEKHSIAIIHANTDNISMYLRINILFTRKCWGFEQKLNMSFARHVSTYGQLYSDLCTYLVCVLEHVVSPWIAQYL